MKPNPLREEGDLRHQPHLHRHRQLQGLLLGLWRQWQAWPLRDQGQDGAPAHKVSGRPQARRLQRNGAADDAMGTKKKSSTAPSHHHDTQGGLRPQGRSWDEPLSLHLQKQGRQELPSSREVPRSGPV